MDKIVIQSEKNTFQRARSWRPRFRTATMLWLMVVLAAFYSGRNSEQFQISARKWWQVTRVRFGASVASHEIIDWPPGGITINSQFPLKLTSVGDGNITSASLIGSRQLRITAKANGRSDVTFLSVGSPFPKCKFVIEVENGRIADWTMEGRP
jgi:hypothetical protein